MSKERLQLSDSQLLAASKDVWHAYIMIKECAELLRRGTFGAGVAQSAVLVAFLVHFRALYHFLYSDPKRKTDLVAQDYVRSWTRPTSELLSQARARVDVQIAHLTQFAITKDAVREDWPFWDVTWELTEAFQEFFRQVRQETFEANWVNL